MQTVSLSFCVWIMNFCIYSRISAIAFFKLNCLPIKFYQVKPLKVVPILLNVCVCVGEWDDVWRGLLTASGQQSTSCLDQRCCCINTAYRGPTGLEWVRVSLCVCMCAQYLYIYAVWASTHVAPLSCLLAQNAASLAASFFNTFMIPLGQSV